MVKDKKELREDIKKLKDEIRVNEKINKNLKGKLEEIELRARE